jgi:hypothetical protein
MSEQAPDLAYSEEVGKVYEQADYHEAVRILVPVSRNDITATHRVVVPKMYRDIARAIGRARLVERERCAKLAESEAGGMEYEDGNRGDAHDDACREIAARIRAELAA